MIIKQDPDISLGKSQIQQRIKDSLQPFVQRCLTADFDVIIPIEGEGLAFILPGVGEPMTGSKPKIVPSNSIEYIDKQVLAGKTILLLDATVRTGKGFEEIRKKLGDMKVPYKELAFAAFLVVESYKGEIRFAIPGHHVLTENQYAWAREILANYLLDEVFVHFGDPPLWQVHFDERLGQEFISELVGLGSAYILPDSREDAQIIRLSLDEIQLSDKSILPSGVEEVPHHKIRFAYNKKTGNLKILPLFFIMVDTEQIRQSSFYDTLLPITRRFPQEAGFIFDLAKDMENTPFNVFRWVTALGSFLMLKDFLYLVENLERINSRFVFNIEISIPVLNLNQYLFDQNFLEAFQQLAKLLLTKHSNARKFDIFEFCFSFDACKQFNPTKWFEVKPPFSDFGPTDAFMFALAHRHYSLETEHESKRRNIADNGLSFQSLCKLASFLDNSAINRVLDRVIDEGLLKPRLFSQQGKLQRTYTLSSESIKNQMMVIGRCLDEVELEGL